MGLLGSLDHLRLPAADVEALAGSYRETLDAVVVEEALPERVRLRLANIDVVIERGEAGPDVVASFRIQDAEAFRALLAASSFELEGVEEVPGAVVLTFRDPAGNRLQAVRWGGRVEDLVERR
ncbi:MAG: VOC family protein [Dehalococcoidia bacterium]|nr:VOC family protein [Dehalococcoidia bacterium]